MYFVLKYPLKYSEVCFEVQRSAYFAVLGLHCRRTWEMYYTKAYAYCYRLGSRYCSPLVTAGSDVGQILLTLGAPSSSHAFCLCVLMMQCIRDQNGLYKAYLPCIKNQNKEYKRHGMMG